MISRAKKYVAVLLVFVCVCMIFSPQTAYAAEDSSQHETVKVGFFAMDGYHVMDEEGNRSGYGYDFLLITTSRLNRFCDGVPTSTSFGGNCLSNSLAADLSI